MTADCLDVSQRNPGVAHLGECSASEAVGADAFDTETSASLSEDEIGARLVNVHKPVPTWKQVLFPEVGVVVLQVLPQGRMDLDLSGVLLALGVDTAQHQDTPDSVNAKHIAGKQGAGFVDPAGGVKADPEQRPIPRQCQTLTK